MIPKFRAWHEQGFMLDVENIVKLNLEEEILEYCVLNEDGVRSDRECYFDEVHLLQSTGLFDKNGVEIFEGDVIVDHLIKGLDKVCFVVVKCDNYLYLKMIRNGIIYNNIIDPMLFNQHAWLNGIEVVGNIYENIDLLGVAE